MFPENYNKDGTIIKGSKFDKSRYSKKLIKINKKIKNLQRKQAIYRKESHRRLVKELISDTLPAVVIVEKMNFKALQKKANKETEINEKTGKYKSKKRFGKSIANRAPAMLLSMLKQTLSYYGIELIKVPTSKTKASQYNHQTNEFKKETLSTRNKVFKLNKKDVLVSRDMYSAFILSGIVMTEKVKLDKDGNPILKQDGTYKTETIYEYNRSKLTKDFKKFVKMQHNTMLEIINGNSKTLKQNGNVKEYKEFYNID